MTSQPHEERARPTVDEVFDMVQLAGTYIEDGAPSTAADRLRRAAAMLDKIAEDRIAIAGPGAVQLAPAKKN